LPQAPELVITVDSCKLLERTESEKALGKSAVVRWCTGHTPDAKEYRWHMEIEEKTPSVGAVVIVQGEVSGPRGENGYRYYRIDTIRCTPYVGVTDPDDSAKVPLETPEELLMTLAVLVEHYGIVEVLRALAAVAPKS
jgi:hypothetical protein